MAEKKEAITLENALHNIQQNLKVPKTQTNNFGNYKYRSCEDILEAVKPLLPEGFILTLDDNLVYIGERYYVEAKASFNHGELAIVCKAFAREPESKKGMDASQITGCASSYARKYALNGLLGICDIKDADSNELAKATKKVKEVFKGSKVVGDEDVPDGKPIAKTKSAIISEPQRKRLFAISKQHEWTTESVKELISQYGYESTKEITKEHYEAICNLIEGKKANEKPEQDEHGF